MQLVYSTVPVDWANLKYVNTSYLEYQCFKSYSQVKVNTGVMATNVWLPSAPKLELFHRMQYSVTPLFDEVESYPLQWKSLKGYG